MKVWGKVIATAMLFCWAHLAAPTSRSLVSRISDQFNPVPGGHGCVNAAGDLRIDPYGIICSLQQRYSYKSLREPKLHVHRTWALGSLASLFCEQSKTQAWWLASSAHWLALRSSVAWLYRAEWRMEDRTRTLAILLIHRAAECVG
jgi:hypothetical protein